MCLEKFVCQKCNPFEKQQLKGMFEISTKRSWECRLEELSMQNPAIAKAVHDLEIISHDPKARVLYKAKRKALMDFQNAVTVSKMEGEAEGEARGKAEGVVEGIAKGKMQEKVELARKMKSKQKPMDEIMKFTGLTREQIEKA